MAIKAQWEMGDLCVSLIQTCDLNEVGRVRLPHRTVAACRGTEEGPGGVDAVELSRDAGTAGFVCGRVVA